MPDEIRKRFARIAIDKLGGPSRVAELFGLDERLVSNWQRRGLPATTHDVLPSLLKAKGLDAPPLMFGQLMAVRKRVTRPPRPKVNGKPQKRRS